MARDPATAEPYEYRTTGEKSYELCAFFDREDERPEERSRSELLASSERFWTHDSGRVCFPVGAMELRRVVVEPGLALEEKGAAPEQRDRGR